MNIIDSIYKTPEAWTQTQYHLVHDSGTSIWTANSFLCLTPDNAGMYGPWERIKLIRAYKWWRKNVPVECFHQRNRGK